MIVGSIIYRGMGRFFDSSQETVREGLPGLGGLQNGLPNVCIYLYTCRKYVYIYNMIYISIYIILCVYIYDIQ